MDRELLDVMSFSASDEDDYYKILGCDELSTVLFCLLILIFNEYILNSPTKLFADDAFVYRQIKKEEDCLALQQNLLLQAECEQK